MGRPKLRVRRKKTLCRARTRPWGNCELEKGHDGKCKTRWWPPSKPLTWFDEQKADSYKTERRRDEGRCLLCGHPRENHVLLWCPSEHVPDSQYSLERTPTNEAVIERWRLIARDRLAGKKTTP